MPLSDLTLPELGLGILSWKGYHSLEKSLSQYHHHGVTDLFKEKLLFLPQIEEEGIDIAKRFSFPYDGTEQNLGILGGFKTMAQSMTSKYLLLAENDYQLSDDTLTQHDCYQVLNRALDHLKSGQSQVWRFRNLQNPGQLLHSHKTLKYWPADHATPLQRLAPAVRRLLRPAKAHHLKGMTVYTTSNPSQKFSDVIQQLENGDYLVRSDVMNWANNIFMIQRDFFLKEVIPQAEKYIGNRLINGFPTIETELNRSGWWNAQKFWIGVSNPGIFTHNRLGDRGY